MFTRVSMLDELGSEQRERLVEALLLGKCHLLLGAGASADSLAQAGDRNLPSGNGLRELLIGSFPELELDIESSLQSVFADVYDERRREVEALLRRQFVGTRPATWVQSIFGLRWKTIWTLNIDDVLEQAFNTSLHPSVDFLAQDTWRDQNVRQVGERTQQVVYLHGRAALLNDHKDPHLVFDLNTYMAASIERRLWHQVFDVAYSDDPFVILGASLDSEPDLEPTLRHGKREFKSGDILPGSIVVSRTIRPQDLRRYRRFGLTAIEGTCEQFIRELIDEIDHSPLRHRAGNPDILLDHDRRAFLAEFRLLQRREGVPRASRNHQPLAGDEPEWGDIDRDDPFLARFPSLVPAADYFLSTGEASLQRRVEISGPPYSGKTGAGYVVADLLVERGLQPYIHNLDETLSYRAAMKWFSVDPTAVLIVDNFGDFLPEIAQLWRGAVDNHVQIRLVLMDRDTRESGRSLQLEVGTEGLLQVPRRRLELDDMISLVERLRRFGRLGEHERQSRDSELAVQLRRQYRGSLFDVLDSAGAINLRARLESELDAYGRDSPGDSAALAAVVTCFVYQFGLPAPLSLLSAVSGMSDGDLIDAIDAGPLGSFLAFTQRGTVQTRHTRYAKSVVSKLSDSDRRVELLVRSIVHLASLVTTDSIIRKSYEQRLLVVLSRWENLTQWIGHDNVLRVYDHPEVLELMGWNSRYWEQRALYLSEVGNFVDALASADVAVNRRVDKGGRARDSMTLVTRAKVRLQYVNSLKGSDAVSAAEWYWAANEDLTAAHENNVRDHEHPYVTFFSYTLSLWKEGIFERSGEVAKLIDEWNRWIRRATKGRASRSPQWKASVDDWNLKSIRAAAERSIQLPSADTE